ICASSVSVKTPSRPALILSLSVPSGVTVIPLPPSPPAATSAPNEMNAFAFSLSTFALALEEYELMCMPLIVAWRLVIVTGPAGTSFAEMLTVLKSLAASWVKNGKPSIDTDGFTGKPCFWNWSANWFSVTASATRSPITSRIRITMTANSAMTERRTLRLRPRRRNPPGAGGCWGDHCGGGVSCGSRCHCDCGCCHCCGACCVGCCAGCCCSGGRCWKVGRCCCAGASHCVGCTGRSHWVGGTAESRGGAFGSGGGGAFGPGGGGGADGHCGTGMVGGSCPQPPAGCAGACTVGGAAVSACSSDGGAGCLVGSVLMVSPRVSAA